MNLNQAYQILDYGIIPRNREEQISLIRIMGYTRLRGGNLLQECPDRQLRRVAERLFRKAEKKAHLELNTCLKEMQDEENAAKYHAFLCEIFNIPEELRDTVTISQLEEELQN